MNFYPTKQEIDAGQLQPGQRLRYTQDDGTEVWAVVQSVVDGVPTVKILHDANATAAEKARSVRALPVNGAKGARGKLAAWDGQDTRLARPAKG